MASAEQLPKQILKQVVDYYYEAFPPIEFSPGITHIPVSGRVFDAEDLVHLVDSSLDFWLTSGRFVEQFECEFAQYLGIRHAILCNSGSSANLLALSALCSPELGEKQLKPNDEVITTVVGFPTTLNAIIQNGLTPVFLDVELTTCNVDILSLQEAISPDTKAIILAHTLGNPFNVEAVMEFVKRHDLWLIEDNCDALGSTYNGQLTGTFGDMTTVSFYPAHHITMGEGGCVLTSSSRLKKIIKSFRDWGRDCWCDPGKENTCTKRFEWQLGQLPYGYDHKYIYSHIGYNLKLTDMQAAIGVAQLKKLDSFIETRRRNWQYLYSGLKPYEEFLTLPQATKGSNPSWFGFLIIVRSNAPFTRNDMIQYLEKNKIATRMLFGGSLIRQPAYKDLNCRIIGGLENSEVVMNQAFWIGIYPGLTKRMLEYVIDMIGNFINDQQGNKRRN